MRYAIDLATDLKAEIDFLFVYRYPISNPNCPSVLSEALMNSDSTTALSEFRKYINKQMPSEHPPFDVHLLPGLVVDNIQQLAKEQETDLIVMGTKGTNGPLDRLLGSNTYAVCQNTVIPVLVIPGDASYQGKYKSIATAQNDLRPKSNLINYLTRLTAGMQPDIHCFHVSADEKDQTFSYVETTIKKGDEQSTISVSKLENHSVVQGVVDFHNSEHFDLLVLISHQKGFFERLFHPSITKEIVEKHAIVSLVIPESFLEE
ncbi:universal stress protein, partial [Chitinophagales bacterium]|nr:universal stress protein [Chitinophagales bacterium]